MILFLLMSTASCGPVLIGEAACGGVVAAGNVAYCAAIQDPDEALKKAVKGFNEDFRFEDYTGALAFVLHDQRKTFWSEADRFKGRILIASFELRDLKLDKKKKHASVFLHLEYWRPESPSLKKVSIEQKWQYSKKDKKWELGESGFAAIHPGDD